MLSLRNRAGKRLREPFGKAGLTVAVIALVFAMLGGAYAAGGLTSKQKKEVKAIAKSFQGTGPAGPAGPAGAKGDTGAAGSNGQNGAPGAAGKSVLVVNDEPENCPNEEGVTYEVQGSGQLNEVCNGEEGEAGEDGETGFTETLPSGKTETGSWSLLTPGKGAISFSIPLAAPLSVPNVKAVPYPGRSATATGTLENGSNVITGLGGAFTANSVNSLISAAGGFIPSDTKVQKKISSSEIELTAGVSGIPGEENPKSGVELTLTPVAPPEACESTHTGTAGPENPEADPGFLCIYIARELDEGGTGFTPPFKAGGNGITAFGASVSGAMLNANAAASKEFWGTFAVTAP